MNITQIRKMLVLKILNAEQSNTSLIFDNKYFLKLYRKLDSTINPDLEITRYLSEKTDYENSPRFRVQWN